MGSANVWRQFAPWFPQGSPQFHEDAGWFCTSRWKVSHMCSILFVSGDLGGLQRMLKSEERACLEPIGSDFRSEWCHIVLLEFSKPVGLHTGHRQGCSRKGHHSESSVALSGVHIVIESLYQLEKYPVDMWCPWFYSPYPHMSISPIKPREWLIRRGNVFLVFNSPIVGLEIPGEVHSFVPFSHQTYFSGPSAPIAYIKEGPLYS